MTKPVYDPTIKPSFKNRENECTKTEDGRTVFLSRSNAVCVPVTAILSNGEMYVLMSRRGEGTPDYQHHFNLVCGYLDNDETLAEAAIREVWEETGFYTEAVDKSHVIFDIKKMPWDIGDNPKPGTRQNITHRFGFIFKINTLNDLPPLTTDNCEKGEVSEVVWMNHKDVLNILSSNEKGDPKLYNIWAFNHYDLYRIWAEKVKFIAELDEFKNNA